MAETVPLWLIQLDVFKQHLDDYALLLEGHAESVSYFLKNPMDDERAPHSLWCLEGFSRRMVHLDQLKADGAMIAGYHGHETPTFSVTMIREKDWITSNLKAFPPIEAGRFFIHGSHFTDKIPAGHIALQLDAGMAFGTGEHATTQGCLLAIDFLLKKRKFKRPLDLGCGSGILAIALAKSLHCSVAAFDIDPFAVEVAQHNVFLNQVGSYVRPHISDGYRRRSVIKQGPYDLIVANILARPLVKMAAGLRSHLAPEGFVILSGLLEWQERMVLSAHYLQGLSLYRRLRIKGWSSLILVPGPAIGGGRGPWLP